MEMNNDEKNIEPRRKPLMGLANLAVAGIVGLFLYESAPEMLRAWDNGVLENMYQLRQDGNYLAYAKEAIESMTFPLVGMSLSLKTGKHIKQAYESFLKR